MQYAEILKISCGEKFGPTGKMQILIRTEIRILPVSTSADPHICTSAFYPRPVSRAPPAVRPTYGFIKREAVVSRCKEQYELIVWLEAQPP